jgi:hypothetical protein
LNLGYKYHYRLNFHIKIEGTNQAAQVSGSQPLFRSNHELIEDILFRPNEENLLVINKWIESGYHPDRGDP